MRLKYIEMLWFQKLNCLDSICGLSKAYCSSLFALGNKGRLADLLFLSEPATDVVAPDITRRKGNVLTLNTNSLGQKIVD